MFSKPGIELAVLWSSSLWTCALGSNADVSPLACGVGIQRLYIPTAGEAGLAPRAVWFQQQEGILPSV